MKLERGLSENTLEAYTEDLRKYLDFLSADGKDFRAVGESDLQQFMAVLADVGIQPRSVARIMSGVRSFYRFLFVEKEIVQDPTELLESPKIGRRLPEVLTVGEIDAMIAAIDLSTAEGHRNRAILNHRSYGSRKACRYGYHFIPAENPSVPKQRRGQGHKRIQVGGRTGVH